MVNNSVECEVNTISKDKKVFKAQSTDLSLFLHIDSILQRVMVKRDRLLPVFKLLVAINKSPYKVKSYFRSVGKSTYLDRSFNYLLSNGYIEETTAARLITCFNKHKIVKVYIISKKGEKVLCQIAAELFNMD